MGNEEKNREKDATESPQPLKVSKAIFDEATGTVTLILATDEEIAEDERIKKEREKGKEKKE